MVPSLRGPLFVAPSKPAVPKLNTGTAVAASSRVSWLLGYMSPRTRAARSSQTGVQPLQPRDHIITARGYEWVGDTEACLLYTSPSPRDS